MSKVSFENNKVLIGRKVIKEFPRPIEGIVKTNTLIIVLLEYDVNSKIDLNVLAINKSGEEIWRIEPDLEADENNPYVSIQNDGTDLLKWTVLT